MCSSGSKALTQNSISGACTPKFTATVCHAPVLLRLYLKNSTWHETESRGCGQCYFLLLNDVTIPLILGRESLECEQKGVFL
jgi:hypothetical protein